METMIIIHYVLHIIALACMFIAGRSFAKGKIYDILGDAAAGTDYRSDNARGRLEAIIEVFDKVEKI